MSAAREDRFDPRPPWCLVHRISRIGRFLSRVYALELEWEPGDFVVDPEIARAQLADEGPRTGVLAVQEQGELQLGLFVDPRDARDVDALVEETSHVLCLLWHASHDLPVSPLVLELQSEVDRFVFARQQGRDPMAHFQGFEWGDWLAAEDRDRYETAHRRGQRYCERLLQRFPDRSHSAALYEELRRFYRSSPQAKLRLAA